MSVAVPFFACIGAALGLQVGFVWGFARGYRECTHDERARLAELFARLQAEQHRQSSEAALDALATGEDLPR